MEKVIIMPFGDSITNGFTVDGAYRNELCARIEADGMKDKVEFAGSERTGTGYDNRNEGHSGWAIADISPKDDCEGNGRSGLTECADKWLADAKPDIVLLQVGTNDILALYDLDNAGKRLERLIDKVFAVLPEYGGLFLATIPYIDEKSVYNLTGKNQRELDNLVNEYNAKVKSLIEKMNTAGRRVTLVDINSQLTAADLQDGVHPCAAAYDKLGRYWYAAVKESIERLIDG